MAKINSDGLGAAGRAALRRREHWRRVLERWKACGLSQAEFCRRQSIPVWKMAWWRKRLKGEATEPAGLFVPVQVAPACASGGDLELTLQSGRILRFGAGVDPTKLLETVAALEKLPLVPTEGSKC